MSVNKKGDMSINMIIIAAIALLVLVIISVLLFSKVGVPLNKGTSCEGVGGFCSSDASCWEQNGNNKGTWAPNTNFECSTDRPFCCMKI